MENKFLLLGFVLAFFAAVIMFVTLRNRKLIDSGEYEALNQKALKDKQSWTRKGFKKIRKI